MSHRPDPNPTVAPAPNQSVSPPGALWTVATAFAVVGVLTLFASAVLFSQGNNAPGGGSTLQLLGMGGFLVGVGYLYAAHHIQAVNPRGLQTGLVLSGITVFVSFIILVQGESIGFSALLINGTFGWLLYTNRWWFRSPNAMSPTHHSRTSTARNPPRNASETAGTESS